MTKQMIEPPVYVTCWFDMHTDPSITVHKKFDGAYEEIHRQIKGYFKRYTWITSMDGGDVPNWMMKGISDKTWLFYVQARSDGGPHGYILGREVI